MNLIREISVLKITKCEDGVMTRYVNNFSPTWVQANLEAVIRFLNICDLI